MRFNLTGPCHDCPFHTNGKLQLCGSRAQEISDALLKNNQTFACHNTIDYDNIEYDDDGNPLDSSQFVERTQQCGGALVYQRRIDDAGYAPNAMLQIAERFGLFDPSRLKLDAPVYQSEEAFVDFHGQHDFERGVTRKLE